MTNNSQSKTHHNPKAKKLTIKQHTSKTNREMLQLSFDFAKLKHGGSK